MREILKTPNSLHIFSMKPPCLISSIKLKTRVACAFAKAKSLLLEFSIILKKNRKQKKLFFGSFRLHYNWCTSHGHPNSHVYYDASWNTTTSLDDHDHQMDVSDELSRYLEWLEGEKTAGSGCNEIDQLADLFIASCHEKFRLEKQESYRRFQEMIYG